MKVTIFAEKVFCGQIFFQYPLARSSDAREWTFWEEKSRFYQKSSKWIKEENGDIELNFTENIFKYTEYINNKDP